jgi:hypothetical protein
MSSGTFLFRIVVLAGWLAPTALCGGILANEDFSQGTAHWDGDLNRAKVSSNPPGLTIELSQAAWTKITQTFETHAVSLDLVVNFQFSPDCTFTPPPPGFPMPPPLAPPNTFGGVGPIVIPPGKWGILLNDPIEHVSTTGEFDAPSKFGPQSLSLHFPLVMRHEEKTLIIVFPQGSGTVTLTRVAFTPSSLPFSGKLPPGIPQQTR